MKLPQWIKTQIYPEIESEMAAPLREGMNLPDSGMINSIARLHGPFH